MATNYTGYQPITFSVQPSGYGRWVTGMAADDGDDDDAAHLMALAMATMDDVQFLGWRCIDWQNPNTVTYTPEGTVIFAVNGTHGWRFNCALDLTSATALFVDYGGVLRIGRPGTGGAGSVGKILCDATGDAFASEIRCVNGAPVFVTAGSYVYAYDVGSGITVYGGAELKNDTDSPYNQYGPHVKIGDAATTRLRVTTISPGDTVSDATAYDVIIVSGGVSNDGGTAQDNHVVLAAPANNTPIGIVVRVCVTVGEQGGSGTNWLEVWGNVGGTRRFFATVEVDGSNKTKAAAFVDLMVSGAGGSSRKWLVYGQSGTGYP